MSTEIWKDVVGYEGYYKVSNLGRVKSMERYVTQGNHKRYVKERIKKQSIDPNGYLRVTLCKDRKSVQIPIHRIIAEAFIPNPENKSEIDHINTNRIDNRIENLRWSTRYENTHNPLTLQNCKERVYTKERTEKINKTRIERGRKCAPKKVYQYSKAGVFIKEYSCAKKAGEELNTNAQPISMCCKGDRLTAGGFVWRFYKEEFIECQKRTSRNARAILQYDRNGVFIKEYKTVSDASKETGIYSGNIAKSARCTGKLRGKYIWKYKDD